MVGHFEPGADPSGDISVGDPVPEIRRLEEVLVDELGETLADLILAPWNQRSVRDGDAQRVTEQGGHREPIGDAPDQRRLGGSPDKAIEPLVATPNMADQEDRQGAE